MALQAHGVTLDAGQYTIIGTCAVLAAISAAAIPSAGLVTMVMVMQVSFSAIAHMPHMHCCLCCEWQHLQKLLFCSACFLAPAFHLLGWLPWSMLCKTAFSHWMLIWVILVLSLPWTGFWTGAGQCLMYSVMQLQLPLCSSNAKAIYASMHQAPHPTRRNPCL